MDGVDNCNYRVIVKTTVLRTATAVITPPHPLPHPHPIPTPINYYPPPFLYPTHLVHARLGLRRRRRREELLHGAGGQDLIHDRSGDELGQHGGGAGDVERSVVDLRGG